MFKDLTGEVIKAIWGEASRNQESEVKNALQSFLEEQGYLVFEDESDARDWALRHTDLEEPEE